MGPRGLYLNKWTLDFDPTQDVPSVVPVWVRLPRLPLHCWNSESLEAIENTLGKYIDRVERKEQYSCARICVKVDLEIGFPEAIRINVADWSHIQELDYEQIPFKCRFCHEYGHFARNCKKKTEVDLVSDKPNQWKQVQKSGSSKQVNKKQGNVGSGTNREEQKSSLLPNDGKDLGFLNPFEVLSSADDQISPILEEGEIQRSKVNIEEGEVNIESDPVRPREESCSKDLSPIRPPISPCYADALKKKFESFGSSEDDGKFAKKFGRKYQTDIREK